MKLLPKELSQYKDGKDIPIIYHMSSVNSVLKKCTKEPKPDAVYKPIEERSVNKCFQVFQNIRESQNKITDLMHDLEQNTDAIPLEVLSQAMELRRVFDAHTKTFKLHLSKALASERSTQYHEVSLMDCLELYLQKDFSPKGISEQLKFYRATIQKIKLVNDFKKNGAIYIGNGGNLDNTLQANSGKRVYVLYMAYDEELSSTDEWHDHMKIFSRLCTAYKSDKEVTLVIADLDFHSNRTKENGICIECHKDGVILCKDVLKEESLDVDKCIIVFNVMPKKKAKIRLRSKSKRIPFEISCPLSFTGKCLRDDCQWTCKVCRKIVEYKIKGKYLYCLCGKSSPYDATFRCSSAMHGLEFYEFESDRLRTELLYMDKVKETNILILGETGVGKSTWINSIANYVAFSSLQDAINARDLKVLIPFQFQITNEKDCEQEISLGSKCDDENMESGQHGTVRPKEYKFCSKHHIISFIDTPGIGDPRGASQDQENIESILDFLASYDKIHAICILLKPQLTRLTTSFTFCTTMLLNHLHKSAVENIVFCFTHTKGTKFTPGGTLGLLKSLFSKDKRILISTSQEKLFCFDNEALRFLACRQNSVVLNETDITDASNCWNKSAGETNRLLKYVESKSPHWIQDTVSLNRARKIIIELSKPLALIADNIQQNIDLANDKFEELKASKKKTDELKELLFRDVVKLVPVPLDTPKTVCTHPACVSYFQVG